MKPTPYLYLAPLQGYTESYFRNAFCSIFKCFDTALSPFIPSGLGEKVKHSRIYDLWHENNKGMPVVPQILGKRSEEIIPLAHYLYDYGYHELNINMGCPVCSIARKGRGSGILASPEMVIKLLSDLCTHTSNNISVKLRLGYHSSNEIKTLLPLINQLPIHQLIIHPRLGNQMYEGEIDIETYQWCLAHANIPIVYSGDIFSLQDFERLQASLPQQREWMIGRGVLYNIFLPYEIKHHQALSFAKKQTMFAAFHNNLLEELKQYGFSERRQLNKLKEYWAYFAYHFQQAEAIHMLLKRCDALDMFLKEVHSIVETAIWSES